MSLHVDDISFINDLRTQNRIHDLSVYINDSIQINSNNRIKTLNLSDENIKIIPNSILKLKDLQSLTIRYELFDKIEDSIFNLDSLENFNITGVGGIYSIISKLINEGLKLRCESQGRRLEFQDSNKPTKLTEKIISILKKSLSIEVTQNIDQFSQDAMDLIRSILEELRVMHEEIDEQFTSMNITMERDEIFAMLSLFIEDPSDLAKFLVKKIPKLKDEDIELWSSCVKDLLDIWDKIKPGFKEKLGKHLKHLAVNSLPSIFMTLVGL